MFSQLGFSCMRLKYVDFGGSEVVVYQYGGIMCMLYTGRKYMRIRIRNNKVGDHVLA